MAGDFVERVYIAGDKSLVDFDYVKKSKSASCLSFFFFMIFVLAFLATFIWLALDKYQR